MSREIKFRAISVNSGEMIFGSYVTDGNNYHAIVYPCIEDDSMMRNDPIDVKTLGQFIGRLDGERTDIYQGDFISDNVGVGAVVWNDENCSFKVSYARNNKGLGKWFRDFLDSEIKCLAVIGNIHQNEDLIKL